MLKLVARTHTGFILVGMKEASVSVIARMTVKLYCRQPEHSETSQGGVRCIEKMAEKRLADKSERNVLMDRYTKFVLATRSFAQYTV